MNLGLSHATLTVRFPGGAALAGLPPDEHVTGAALPIGGGLVRANV